MKDYIKSFKKEDLGLTEKEMILLQKCIEITIECLEESAENNKKIDFIYNDIIRDIKKLSEKI